MKATLASLIARHRRSAPLRQLHRLVRWFDRAWHNESTDGEYNGEYAVLRRLAPAGFSVAVDAGANVGEWSRAALERWPSCRVHAFEVAPQTYEVLRTGSAATHGARLIAHNVGLYDAPGTKTMYYFADEPRLTADMPRHEGRAVTTFDGQMTTLDAFAAEHGIDRLDYLKIDVEGAEHRVLAGARDLLRRRAISCIQFEYGAFSLQTRFLLEDYHRLLAETYEIGKIYPDHVAFGAYDWRTEDFRFSNYLCILRDRRELIDLVRG